MREKLDHALVAARKLERRAAEHERRELVQASFLGYQSHVSLSTFVRHSLRDPSYVWRRLIWGVHRHIPERRITMPTRHGRMSFSSRDYVIGRSLCLESEYGIDAIERAEAILSREPRRGHVMLDVGANIGTVCLSKQLRRLYPQALAIEPEPGNFSLLASNIERNGLGPTTRALRLGLSDHDGSASMRISSDNHGDHRISRDGSGEGGVKLQRLDDVLLEQRIPADAVGLVWMDVQGYEPQVLAGADELLTSAPPLVTEFWPHGLVEAGNDPAVYLDTLRTHYSRFCTISASGVRSVESLEPTATLTLDRFGLSRDSGIQAYVDLLLLP